MLDTVTSIMTWWMLAEDLTKCAHRHHEGMHAHVLCIFYCMLHAGSRAVRPVLDCKGPSIAEA